MSKYRYRLLLMVGTLSATFFFERVVAVVLGGKIFMPPLLLFAGFAWFPVLSFPLRLWVGGGIGVFYDSFADIPFGTATLVMLFLAVLTEFLRLIISHRDSLLAKVAIAAGLMSLSLLCIVYLGKLIIYFRI